MDYGTLPLKDLALSVSVVIDVVRDLCELRRREGELTNDMLHKYEAKAVHGLFVLIAREQSAGKRTLQSVSRKELR